MKVYKVYRKPFLHQVNKKMKSTTEGVHWKLYTLNLDEQTVHEWTVFKHIIPSL